MARRMMAFSCPPEFQYRVLEAAHAQHTTMSAFIRKCVDEILARDPRCPHGDFILDENNSRYELFHDPFCRRCDAPIPLQSLFPDPVQLTRNTNDERTE